MPSVSGSIITPPVRREIVKIIDERIREAHVTREDFTELKSIVKDIAVKLGELTVAQNRTEQRVEELAVAQTRTEQKVEELAVAQKRTEQRVEELTVAQKELTEAQKRTEQRLEELAVAQKRTEQRLEELAEAQKRTENRVEELAEAQRATETQIQILTKRVGLLEVNVGGMARSMGYAFENEVYRNLPRVLAEKYSIQVKDKIIRSKIAGHEVNIFGRALRGEQEILIVGEAKVRLEEKRAEGPTAFDELDEKVEAVKSVHSQVEIVPMLITHFATPRFLQKANEKGIIVVQSFEW